MKYVDNKDNQLFIKEKAIENPKENELQIEVYSSGVNRADLLKKK
jgi:Zn-dependent alcohol dehydrogenase